MDNLTALARAARRLTTAQRDRDRLLVAARQDGATWPQLCEATGLTDLGARKAATRANGGTLPRPRG